MNLNVDHYIAYFVSLLEKMLVGGLCSSPRAEDHIICKSNNVHLLNACCELDTGLSTLLILLHLSFPTILQKAEAQSDFK